MAETVATLQAVFTANTTAFDRGVASVSNSMQNAQRSMVDRLKSMGASITGLGASITAATAPFSLFAAKGVSAAADFDAAMAEISARTGTVGADLEEVRQFALQMGSDTAFSAQQASDAFLELLSSGQSTSEAMATLPHVLNAAAASGEDLGRTADILTNIMASFGLEVDAAESTVNALAAAAGASSADIASLGQGFANLGPVASQFGLGVEDTAAALAVLAENGIAGAEAGTQLKSMLLSMGNDTASVQQAWNRLGTSLYDAEGNMRDFDTVLGEISVSLAAMPVEEQNRVMQDLAGSYGIVGLQALLGAGGIDGMLAAMDEQASAADIAAARMDTYKGAVDALKGSVETLMINAFTPFMNDVLKPQAQRMTQIVNAINVWVTANPELASSIIQVMSAAASLGAALIPLGMAITFLLSPINLLIIAAGALAIAWKNDIGGIQATTAEWLSTAQAQFKKVSKTIGAAMNVASGALTDFIDAFDMSGLKSSVTEVVRDVMGSFDELLNNLRYAGSEISEFLGKAFNLDFSSIGNLIHSLGNAFSSLTANIDLEKILQVGMTLYSLTSPIGWIMTGLKALGVNFGDIFNGILTAVGNFFGALNDGLGIWDALTAALGNAELVNVLRAGFEAVAGIVQNVLVPAFNTFIGILGGLWEQVRPFFDNFVSAFSNMPGDLSGVGGQISDVFATAVQTIFYELGRLPGRLAALLTEILPVVLQYGPTILQGILTGMGAIAVWAWENIVKPFAQGLIDGVGDLIAAVIEYGPSILQGIKDGLGDMVQWAHDNIVQPLMNKLESSNPELAGAVSAIADGMKKGLQGFIDFVGKFWEFIQPGIDLFKQGIEIAFNVVKDVIIPNLQKGIQAFIDWAIKFWEFIQPGIDLFKQGLEIAFLFVTETLLPALQKGVQAYIDWAIKFWEFIQPGIELFKQGLEIAFHFVTDTLLPALQKGVQAYIDWAIKFWEFIQPGIQAFRDGIEIIFNFIKDTIIPNLKTGFEGFIEFIGTVWTAIQPGIQAVQDGFDAAFTFIKDNVITPAKTSIDTFKGLVLGIWNNVSGGIEDVKTGFDEGFGFIEDNVITPFSDVINGIPTMIEWVATVVKGPLQIIEGLFKGIFDAIAGAVQAVLNVIGGVVGAAQEAASAVSTIAGAVGAAPSTAAALADQGGDIIGNIIADPGRGVNAVIKGLGLGSGASGITWTGAGPVNEVAGVFHRQESIVPHTGMKVIPSPQGLMLEGKMSTPVESPGGRGSGSGGTTQVFTGDMYFQGIGNIDDLYDQLERVGKQRAG